MLTQAGSKDRSAAAFLGSSVLDTQRHPNLAGWEHESITASREFISWAVNDAIEREEVTTDITAGDLVETLVAVMWGMELFTSVLGYRDDLPEVVHTFELLLANKLWWSTRF